MCLSSHLTLMIQKRFFFTWTSMNCTKVQLNQVWRIPPPTFDAGGMLPHSTTIPLGIIRTAKIFYTFTKGYCICVQPSRYALHKLGIVTKFEEPKPVGQIQVGETWYWVCPHIFGGIPTEVPGVVTSVYEIQRDAEGRFLSVSGLTDD